MTFKDFLNALWAIKDIKWKKKKLRNLREEALNKQARVLTEIYGDRCDRHEAMCLGCQAWAIFDLMERITDTSLIY